MTEIYFRKSELHVFGRDGNVTPGDYGEAAAEHPTVDFRDHRLGHSAQHLIAPLAGFLSHLVTHAVRLRVHLDEILLQILPRAETFAGSSYNNHSGVLVVTQVGQAIIHLAVKL